jgi:hypothetical protein
MDPKLLDGSGSEIRFGSGSGSKSGGGSKTNRFCPPRSGSGSTALTEGQREWKNWILTWLGAAAAVVLAVAPPGGGGRRGPTAIPVVLHQVGNTVMIGTVCKVLSQHSLSVSWQL